jgi:hypothetical protein
MVKLTKWARALDATQCPLSPQPGCREREARAQKKLCGAKSPTLGCFFLKTNLSTFTTLYMAAWRGRQKGIILPK